MWSHALAERLAPLVLKFAHRKNYRDHDDVRDRQSGIPIEVAVCRVESIMDRCRKTSYGDSWSLLPH